MLLAAAVLLSACTDESPVRTDASAGPTPQVQGDLYFPHYRPSDSALAGDGTGVLVQTRHCLWLRESGQRWLLIWPDDLRAVRDAAGVSIILPDGRQAATTGMRVRVTGGEYRDKEGQAANRSATQSVVELIGAPLPEDCAEGLYWIVTGIEPEA